MVPYLKTILIAMSPIVELRGAIPVAIGSYHLPVWLAFLLSVLGNLIPVILILMFLEPISQYLSKKSNLFKRALEWIFKLTKKRHKSKFKKYGKFALVVLVAIPLPFTGAWTGSLCAFLFGIPFRHSFPLIAIGIIIAGIIVSLASLGIITIL